MRGVTKRFPGVVALAGVDFALRRGEIHGVAGENGSGKSTLMKVLAGSYEADVGEVEVGGRPVSFSSPSAALRSGVALIAQEVLVHPDLSVAENLLFNRTPRRRWGGIDWPRTNAAAADVLARLRLDVRPSQRLGTLPLHQQHMIAIGKMIERQPEVLILDEPTSSLAQSEVETLYGLIREMRDGGTAIVYITHRLREYFDLADRVTVLRDGHLVATRPTRDLDETELVKLMVGRELTSIFHRPDDRVVPPAEAPPALRVRGFRSRKLRGIDLDVKRGEIVGVAGQAGAGRSTLARTLFGLHPGEGTVEVAGEEVTLNSPRAAMAAGIGFAPEDRKGAGLVLSMSVGENIAMPQWGTLSRAGFQTPRRRGRLVANSIESFGIRCRGPLASVDTLSGGNQQKVVLAKWMARDPVALLLDEPTRGVDVGAKAEIYSQIERLAEDGAGILVFSSELLELLRLSDRVVVLAAGAVAGELTAAEATEESITNLAFRGVEVAA